MKARIANRKNNSLLDIYRRLYAHYGAQGWWPGKTRFEVITGAILTQNTAWSNVEKAIRNLKEGGLLSPAKIRNMGAVRLSKIIRPSGYHNIKARTLANFVNLLFTRYRGSLNRFSAQRTDVMRQELLNVKGIGQETCDSILLYAFKKPIFVVDAYTKRIFSRHGFLDENEDYGFVQDLFMGCLPKSERLYNEYHALVVRVGKEYCRPKLDCGNCPLSNAAAGDKIS